MSDESDLSVGQVVVALGGAGEVGRHTGLPFELVQHLDPRSSWTTNPTSAAIGAS